MTTAIALLALFVLLAVLTREVRNDGRGRAPHPGVRSTRLDYFDPTLHRRIP